MNEIYFGDNLEVLSNAIFKKHLGKIKTIYIDPPYNTNTKKSYKDNFKDCQWEKFMLDRLIVSKQYLREDGCIFISIDDNEYAILKIACDKVFGKDNYVGTFITKQSQRSNAKHINIVHEYILCYAKQKKKLNSFVIKRIDVPEERKMINRLNSTIKSVFLKNGQEYANIELKKIIKDLCYKNNISWLRNYSNVDENGDIFFAIDLSTPSKPRDVFISEINLKLNSLATRGWISDEKFVSLFNSKRLCFKDGRPYAKKYLYEAEDNVPSILNYYSRQGTNDLKKLGIANIFDTPKSVEMLKFFLRISTGKGDVVMDFFAGSGSLAQAVYELNIERKYNIEYVLIQSKEEINKNTIVYKTCTKLNIVPSVDSILKYRIDLFLEKSNLKIDYCLHDLDK